MTINCIWWIFIQIYRTLLTPFLFPITFNIDVIKGFSFVVVVVCCCFSGDNELYRLLSAIIESMDGDDDW